MWLEHLKILVDPHNKQPLTLKSAEYSRDGRVQSGVLVEFKSRSEYPIVNFIPRFVGADNYAAGFGLQWNIHRKTQYDSYSGHPVSEERYKRETKWPDDLSKELLLEAGCGSGRFTPHALATGATVVSFDYSDAVDASYQNNGGDPNLLLIQADIYQMPFMDEYFDRVFCFGVLQHTPDPHRSFMEIVRKLRPGGSLASDVYIKNFARYVIGPKYKIRPFTKHIDPQKLYKYIKRYVDFMWPLARGIRGVPKVGRLANWMLLIPDYSGLLKEADEALLKEWACLDAFDMLAPRFDYPQTVRDFTRWHREAGLVNIEVHPGYNGVEGRGQAPFKT